MEFSRHSNNLGYHGEEFYRDFKQADYRSINDYFSFIDWDNLFVNKSLDLVINDFYMHLYQAINLFVPLKKTSSRKFPIWYSPQLKNLIITKQKVHAKFKKNGQHSDYLEFSRLRSLCKKLSKDCYNGYVNQTEHNIIQDPKSFWKFINAKRNTDNIPYEMHYNNEKCDTGPQIANLFAEYYSSIYCDKHCDIPSQTSTNNISISNINFEISDIYIRLSELDCNKGPGPDGIPPSLLRYCAFILARPLFFIFNLSLSSGYLPFCWKTSFIIPIHKSGSRSEVKNYRPVSILNVIPKLFENIITDRLTVSMGGFIMDRNSVFSMAS